MLGDRDSVGKNESRKCRRIRSRMWCWQPINWGSSRPFCWNCLWSLATTPFWWPVFTAVVSEIIILTLLHALYSSSRACSGIKIFSADPLSQDKMPRLRVLAEFLKHTTWYSLLSILFSPNFKQNSSSLIRFFSRALTLSAFLITRVHQMPQC